MTNWLNLFAVARNKPRSDEGTLSMKNATQLGHPVSAGSGSYSMGQLYQIKLVAYLWGFVYFFRKLAGWLVASALFPPPKDCSNEVNEK